MKTILFFFLLIAYSTCFAQAKIVYNANNMASLEIRGEVVAYDCEDITQHWRNNTYRFIVLKNGSYSIIDFVEGKDNATDRITVPYDGVYPIEQYVMDFIVKKDGKYGVASEYEELIAPVYDTVLFNNGILEVTGVKDGKYTLFNVEHFNDKTVVSCLSPMAFDECKITDNLFSTAVKNDTTYFLYSANQFASRQYLESTSNHAQKYATEMTFITPTFLLNVDNNKLVQLFSESATLELTAGYPNILVSINKPSEFAVIDAEQAVYKLKPNKLFTDVKLVRLNEWEFTRYDLAEMHEFLQVRTVDEQNGFSESIYFLDQFFCLAQVNLDASEHLSFGLYPGNYEFLRVERINSEMGKSDLEGYCYYSSPGTELLTLKPSKHEKKPLSSEGALGPNAGLFWLGGK